jgi:hypothetical protein
MCVSLILYFLSPLSRTLELSNSLFVLYPSVCSFLQVVTVLLEHQACVHTLVEADHSAALTFCRCPATARVLLQHQAKLAQLITWSENRLWQGGPTAAELFRLYMEYGGQSLIDSRSRSQMGDPPLLKLLQGPLRSHKLVEAVELVLQYGADPHVRSSVDQRTPLQIVCAYSTDEDKVLALLLASGADTTGRVGKAPVDLCIQLRKFASLNIFLGAAFTLTPRQRITLRDLQMPEAAALLRLEADVQQLKDKQRKQAADENMRQLLAELESEGKQSGGAKRRGKGRGGGGAKSSSNASNAHSTSSPVVSRAHNPDKACSSSSSSSSCDPSSSSSSSSASSSAQVRQHPQQRKSVELTQQQQQARRRQQPQLQPQPQQHQPQHHPQVQPRSQQHSAERSQACVDANMHLGLWDFDPDHEVDSDSEAECDAEVLEPWEERAARIMRLLDDQRALQQQQLDELIRLRESHHDNTVRLRERHKHLDPCFQVQVQAGDPDDVLNERMDLTAQLFI